MYVYLTLTIMDIILLKTVKGYQPVDSLWLALIFFFIASHIFIYMYRDYRIKNYLFYYFGALAVFFPLVLIATIVRVLFELSEDGFHSYIDIYCGEQAGEIYVCGEAFSFVVYSMTIRSLPTVITVPILYRYLYVELLVLLMKLVNKY